MVKGVGAVKIGVGAALIIAGVYLLFNASNNVSIVSGIISIGVGLGLIASS